MKSELLHKIIGAVALLFVALALVYWIMQPHSYEDCVLKHVKNAKTDSGAQIVRVVCAKKFKQ